MQVKLAKVPYEYKDKKGTTRVRFNFYIVTSENHVERIECENWKDKDGKYHTNYDILCAFAVCFSSRQEIKF